MITIILNDIRNDGQTFTNTWSVLHGFMKVYMGQILKYSMT